MPHGSGDNPELADRWGQWRIVFRTGSRSSFTLPPSPRPFRLTPRRPPDTAQPPWLPLQGGLRVYCVALGGVRPRAALLGLTHTGPAAPSARTRALPAGPQSGPACLTGRQRGVSGDRARRACHTPHTPRSRSCAPVCQRAETAWGWAMAPERVLRTCPSTERERPHSSAQTRPVISANHTPGSRSSPATHHVPRSCAGADRARVVSPRGCRCQRGTRGHGPSGGRWRRRTTVR